MSKPLIQFALLSRCFFFALFWWVYISDLYQAKRSSCSFAVLAVSFTPWIPGWTQPKTLKSGQNLKSLPEYSFCHHSYDKLWWCLYFSHLSNTRNMWKAKWPYLNHMFWKYINYQLLCLHIFSWKNRKLFWSYTWQKNRVGWLVGWLNFNKRRI